MKSSSYYYTLMLDYSRSKRNYENKIELYKSYIKKLNSTSNSFNFAYSNFINAENYLLDGGYAYQGKSFDNGKLKNNYNKIEDVLYNLKNVISKTEIKIQEFDEQVKYFTNLYNEASANYNRAKNMEANNV